MDRRRERIRRKILEDKLKEAEERVNMKVRKRMEEIIREEGF